MKAEEVQCVVGLQTLDLLKFEENNAVLVHDTTADVPPQSLDPLILCRLPL